MLLDKVKYVNARYWYEIEIPNELHCHQDNYFELTS